MRVQTRIKDLRVDHDVSQQQIADYLQCDQSLYSKYERGERDTPLYVVYKLALYYQVSSDYLLYLTDDKTPQKPSAKNVNKGI